MSLGTLLSMIVLSSTGTGAWPQTKSPPPGSVDAAVIVAATSAFYSESSWRSPDWAEGDFVVLSPAWNSQSRPSFASVLDNLIVSAFFRTGAEAELKQLEDIKSSIRSGGDAYDPGQLLQLSRLKLPDCIVVAIAPRRDIKSHERAVIENSAGKKGTVRMSCSLYPPSYSHDGRYALVLMVGLPDGLHIADLVFLLERCDKGWAVVYTRTY